MAKKQSIDKGLYYSATCGVRAVNLEDYGVPCVPLLSRNHFTNRMPSVEEHVHVGFVEILYCLGGNITYESMGKSYAFRPGKIFVSRPDEPHRRCDNPKGMMLYRLLFRLPPKGRCVLGLSAKESAFVAQALLSLPFRLFHATKRLRAAFVRLFAVFDSRETNRLVRRLEMRNAAQELLLALIEAPRAPHLAKGHPSAKAKEIARRIAEHPEADYPVAELAAESSLSSFALTEAFKRVLGITPSQIDNTKN